MFADVVSRLLCAEDDVMFIFRELLLNGLLALARLLKQTTWLL